MDPGHIASSPVEVGALGAEKSKLYFILVHGASMGAWCWYKLKSLFENKGYNVIVPDLAASGVNEANINAVNTFNEYNQPLFDEINNLAETDIVILVGHGIGGISIALAAEYYPKIVKATVFLGAIVPDTKHAPSLALQKFLDSLPEGFWKDTYTSMERSKEVLRLGPKFLKSTLYYLSPEEDPSLAEVLVRTSSHFEKSLSELPPLTDQNYGSVKRVVIISDSGPKGVTKAFNNLQMTNAGIKLSEHIDKSDDMAMVSQPKKVFDILLKISTIL